MVRVLFETTGKCWQTLANFGKVRVRAWVGHHLTNKICTATGSCGGGILLDCRRVRILVVASVGAYPDIKG